MALAKLIAVWWSGIGIVMRVLTGVVFRLAVETHIFILVIFGSFID
jgi:hypothetical protein